MESSTAPVLSTPAEHIFEDSTVPVVSSSEDRLTEEELYIQYEIPRTIREIRAGRWRRIALQFPDEMLVDAPRVFETLRDGLKRERRNARSQHEPNEEQDISGIAESLESTNLDRDKLQVADDSTELLEERLCILGDTSFGACCVDEVAAEHVDADVVVHYGRACLSPTARLPVIYVFTTKPLDIETAVTAFKQTYSDREEKVCLVADIPYSHYSPELHKRLRDEGYRYIEATSVVRDPSSLIPNRTIPSEVQQNPEKLKEYSVFHISNPPTSLLLILSSRVKRIHILPTDTQAPAALEATTAQVLRRRYALLTRLSTVPIFGILVNTLSVSNYMAALQHCQDLISRAGKKSYVFVVGKVNAAKLANFSEIGGWVVIGCWESSLLESKDFFRPVITPFELEIALKADGERVWGSEWIADFAALLGRDSDVKASADDVEAGEVKHDEDNGNWDDQPSDDEPPEFDLRTGQYVSRTRPMGRAKTSTISQDATASGSTLVNGSSVPPSSALVQRAKGDVATINGTLSPGAEFLRSKRTWQGLGSDHEIAYERDEDGKIRGAAMEEGRSGVARGYVAGSETDKT